MNFFQRLGAVRYLLTGLAVALVAVGGTAAVGAMRSDSPPPKDASADLAAAAPTRTPAARPTTARPTPTKAPTKRATPKSTPKTTPKAINHKSKAKPKPSPVRTRKAEPRKVATKKPAATVKPRAVTHKAKPAPKSVTDGTISRAEVLARARTWLTPSISYDMNGSAAAPDGVMYRSDCSGYASMALHLDAPGRSTIDLPDVTHVLRSKDDLKPGDLLGIMGPDTGGAGGHVMIFVKWNDTSHSSFTVWEHSGNPDQPHKSVYDWPIQDSRGTYLPYRYDKIVD
ncbi:hypothetical protein [Actinopolymorpha singaporensis]|uniref:Cell wall-associated hydrolase, NlpC family n=1 Tax=Actinopolymorpha singaporensis TaxID=117157 RepID=A0A1H1RC44_9ACTN|nr:hypothetical protein [Actinopolymorpha singaporensis]SDS33357.1 hypothetical protein SAMN04489717_2361 [Actinopolymorpha singaporensis]